MVTGISGFVGPYLAEHLLARGVQVAGLARHPLEDPRLSWLTRKVRLVYADLMDAKAVRHAVAETEPDHVYHLAAQSAPAKSREEPEETYRTNILGQLHLLEAIRGLGLHPRVLIVGSNLEYGDPETEKAIDEGFPLRPATPYAVSKVAQDLMGWQYYRAYGMDCVRVRPFNHTGPGQREIFVASSLAKQVAQAEAGEIPPEVHVGNPRLARDFTDVRDMVRAYRLALELGQSGEVYNLGSGVATPLGNLLDYFMSQARVPLQTVVEPALVRPGEALSVRCDNSKFRQLTGWQPEISLETTLGEMLDYWRHRVRDGAAEGAIGAQGEDSD